MYVTEDWYILVLLLGSSALVRRQTLVQIEKTATMHKNPGPQGVTACVAVAPSSCSENGSGATPPASVLAPLASNSKAVGSENQTQPGVTARCNEYIQSDARSLDASDASSKPHKATTSEEDAPNMGHFATAEVVAAIPEGGKQLKTTVIIYAELILEYEPRRP